MICKPDQVYIDFFKKTKKERIIFLRGGRRSGKTFAVFYRFIVNAEWAEPKSILITSDTHPNLGKVMRDFEMITGVLPVYVLRRSEFIANYRNTVFRFKSYPTYQDAKGTEADELYINEGDGVSQEVFETLELGIRNKIIVDHNPTDQFWGSIMQNSQNTIITTFLNNSFLTQEQKDAFQKIVIEGKNAPVGSPEYKRYSVQILGEFAELGGQVFNRLFFINEDDFESVEFVKYLGLDFGDTQDPNAIVSVKFDFENKKMYIKEEFYLSLVPDTMLADKLKTIQGTKHLIYETATSGGTRIVNMYKDTELRNKIKPFPVKKQSVYSSVFEMTEWTLYICGKNAQLEFEGYKVKEGEFDGADHIIDAARYVFIMVVLLKLVK